MTRVGKTTSPEVKSTNSVTLKTTTLRLSSSDVNCGSSFATGGGAVYVLPFESFLRCERLISRAWQLSQM